MTEYCPSGLGEESDLINKINEVAIKSTFDVNKFYSYIESYIELIVKQRQLDSLQIDVVGDAIRDHFFDYTPPSYLRNKNKWQTLLNTIADKALWCYELEQSNFRLVYKTISLLNSSYYSSGPYIASSALKKALSKKEVVMLWCSKEQTEFSLKVCDRATKMLKTCDGKMLLKIYKAVLKTALKDTQWQRNLKTLVLPTPPSIR